MEKMEEYHDALTVMQIAVAFERRENGHKARPNLRLRACCSKLSERIQDSQVKLVIAGIARQAQPVAALTKTVREYETIMRRIKEEGHVILKFKR